MHDLIKKTIKAAQDLQKCQDNFCKKEKEHFNKDQYKINVEINELFEKLKDNKIDRDKYHKQLMKIRVNMMSSKPNRDLVNCSINNCESNMRIAFESMLDMFKANKDLYAQDPMKKAYFEGKKLLKDTKKIDVKKYMNITMLISNALI